MTADRIRIELSDELRFHQADDALITIPTARIWIADGPAGNLSSSRKPAVKLDGDSRASLLRNLAQWIEQEEDPGLGKLAADFAAGMEAL